MAEKYANEFATTLAAAITSTGATTITTAAAAPAGLQGGQFRVRIDNEILIVTGGETGTSWTVTRGAEGSTAATHSNGAAVTHVLTAGAVSQILVESGVQPTIFDAKGDLLGASAADTAARVPVGTDGQLLRADSSQTAGVAYGGLPQVIWEPSQNGLIAANYDHGLFAAAHAAPGSDGVMYLQKLWVPIRSTITNLLVIIGSAGSGFTANRNYGALYASDGTLIAKTADQASAWGSAGMKAMALTAEAGQSLTLGGPGVWVLGGIMVTASTRPPTRFVNGGDAALVNYNLSGRAFRASTAGSGLTTPPSTLGTQTGYHLLFWMGLS